jgi:hypothetical protein
MPVVMVIRIEEDVLDVAGDVSIFLDTPSLGWDWGRSTRVDDIDAYKSLVSGVGSSNDMFAVNVYSRSI